MSVAIIFLLCAFILMLLGIPIGIAFGIAGFTGLAVLRGLEPALILIGGAPYAWSTMDALLPLPLFTLMGLLTFQSGISTELFDAGNKWLGKFPGGLAQATTLACTGFAACTGNTVAAASSMGTVAFPEMKKYGYDNKLSTACIAAGGTLGILIPPSGPFILYGFITQTSVGDLFIAGILPGILLSGMFLVQIYIRCKLNPNLGPPSRSYPWREKVVSLKGVWGMLLLFLLIIGGLYMGIFAPSEAGAIGAAGAFLVALLKGRLTKSGLAEALMSSSKITCSVFTLIIGAMIFNTVLSVSGISTLLTDWISSLELQRYVIIIMIILMYLILGMFMDVLSVVLLTLPTIAPIIANLGFDLVWFCVLICVLSEIALITPPLAINLYVVQGVTHVPFGDIARGIVPFVLTMILFLAILVIFPQICLFLPNTMR